MTLTPLLEAASAVQLHTLAAGLALVGGPVQAVLLKGGRAHRWSGYVWVGVMAIVALSSFRIESRWPLVLGYGPIHLLSIAAIATLPFAVWAARRGRWRAHRAAMVSLWLFALLIPGVFTLLPGRMMHAVFF